MSIGMAIGMAMRLVNPRWLGLVMPRLGNVAAWGSVTLRVPPYRVRARVNICITLEKD